MDHQQFEKWILLDNGLSQEQHRELHGHLKHCSRCLALYQSIHQLDHLFRTAPEPAPGPDFSARWLERAEKTERRRNRLILGITLAVISLSTMILLSFIGLELRSALDTFPQILLRLVTLIAEWLVFLNQLSNILTPLVRVGAKLISPLWTYLFLFGLSGAAGFWILTSIRSKSLQKELNS